MMLQELQRIKASRRVAELGHCASVKFVPEAEDVDDETLQELIPFETDFTDERSIRFRRELLTAAEECEFKGRMATFLRSCFRYMKEDGAVYFLEYMCRRYSVHTFNAEDLAFLLLPFRRFYSAFLDVSSSISPHLQHAKNFSYGFLANMYLRDRYFKLFVAEYFGHYDTCPEIRDLLKGVAESVLGGGRDNENDILELAHSFLGVQDDSFAARLCSEAPTVRTLPDGDIGAGDSATKSRCGAGQGDSFDDMWQNRTDRRLISSMRSMLEYFDWLEAHGKRELASFSPAEINFIRSMQAGYCVGSFNETEISKIFGAVDFKLRALKFLRKCGFNCLQLFRSLNTREQALFCSSANDPDFVLAAIAEDNYRNLLGSLRQKLPTGGAQKLLHKCLHFGSFSATVLGPLVTEEATVNTLRMCEEKFHAGGSIDPVYAKNLSDMLLYLDIGTTKVPERCGGAFLEYLARTRHTLSAEQLEEVLQAASHKNIDLGVLVLRKCYTEDRFDRLFFSSSAVLESRRCLAAMLCFVEEDVGRISSHHLRKIFLRFERDLSVRIYREILERRLVPLARLFEGFLGKAAGVRQYCAITPEKQTSCLKILSGLKYRDEFSVPLDSLPFLEILSAAVGLERCTENEVFLTEVCVSALSHNIEKGAVLELLLGRDFIFRSLPMFVESYPELAEILITEGLSIRTECTEFVLAELLRKGKYGILSRLAGSLPCMGREFVESICKNLKGQSFDLLSVLVEQRETDLLPFLQEIFKFCADACDVAQANVVTVALVRRYGDITYRYLGGLLCPERGLFELVLKRVETRLVLKVCVEELLGRPEKEYLVDFISRCLQRMKAKGMHLGEKRAVNILEIVRTVRRPDDLCIGLLGCIRRTRTEVLRLFFREIFPRPSLLFAVMSSSISEPALIPFFVDDLFCAILNGRYDYLGTFSLCISMLREKRHRKVCDAFSIDRLKMVGGALIGNADTLHETCTEIMAQILAMRPEVIDVLLPEMLRTLRSSCSVPKMRILTEMFVSLEESAKFVDEVGMQVFSATRHASPDIAAAGEELARAVERRAGAPIDVILTRTCAHTEKSWPTPEQ